MVAPPHSVVGDPTGEPNDTRAIRTLEWPEHEIPAPEGLGHEGHDEGAPMDSAHAIGTPDLASPGSRLSDRDKQVLEFERQWWKYAGAKEQAVRELFDMSATRYYQVLNALLDNPDALAFDPMLVKRLRRMRAQRQRQRSARRLGIDL